MICKASIPIEIFRLHTLFLQTEGAYLVFFAA